MLTGQPYAFVSKVSKKNTYSKNISDFFFVFVISCSRTQKKDYLPILLAKKLYLCINVKRTF